MRWRTASYVWTCFYRIWDVLLESHRIGTEFGHPVSSRTLWFPADRLGKSWCWRCARALTAKADMLGTGFIKKNFWSKSPQPFIVHPQCFPFLVVYQPEGVFYWKPAGLLKKQEFVNEFGFKDVDCCKCGFKPGKRTRLWNMKKILWANGRTLPREHPVTKRNTRRADKTDMFIIEIIILVFIIFGPKSLKDIYLYIYIYVYK